MLQFTADSRDGAPSACCCKNISLLPGETNLVTINFAPWSVPIGSPGIIPTFEFALEDISAGCPTNAIDGFAQPQNSNIALTTTVAGTLGLTLNAGATPVGNTFTTAIVPLTGPYNGTLTLTGPAGSGLYDYVPNNGFIGYEYFTYSTTDAQGRKIFNEVLIAVGSPVEAPDRARTSAIPFIDMSKVVTDQRLQTVSFPLTMPSTVQACNTYKLSIKQPAQDCARNLFHNFMCFDIVGRNCA